MYSTRILYFSVYECTYPMEIKFFFFNLKFKMIKLPRHCYKVTKYLTWKIVNLIVGTDYIIIP